MISAFGLFNDRFPESSRYYGTSIPRVVVVNPDGVITHAYQGHGYTSDFEIETIVNRAAGLPEPAS